MKRSTAIVFSLLCLTAVAVMAGEPITIGETVQVQSKIMGEERTVLISTPPAYEQGAESYPVLYMTDGAAHLTHTRGTVDFLSGNGLMPQVIIVAVANTDRTRDLTPSNATMVRDDGEETEFPTSGGASKFLDFFEKELIPFVDSEYRTQPFRLFSGHSFGGLFALNAAFTRPELFQAVLSVSPSLMWDEELPTRQAKTFFADREKHGAILYVAMGNEEEGDPRPNRLDRLEKVLEEAQVEGFEWEVKRLPDETHGSVVLRAHYWGLRSIFEAWQLPRDPESGRFAGGVDDVLAHFAGLSKRFGFAITPGEQQVNLLGYQALGNDDSDLAIEFFSYNIKLYPNAANVYDSFAEALETAGRMDDALANYTKAVETAEKVGDQRLELFRANLDRFVKERKAEAAE